MTENNENVSLSIESSSQKSGVDTVYLAEMMKKLLEKQNEQDKTNKEIIENQQKLMEKLQSIEDNQNGRKRKREDSSSEDPAKRVDLNTSAADERGQLETVTDTSGTTNATGLLNQKIGKCFTLKYTFKNMSKLENGVYVRSEPEEHFGVRWRMLICRNEEHLAFRTQCQSVKAKKVWSIETDWEVKTMSKNGNPDICKTCIIYKPEKKINESTSLGWPKFMKWDILEKDHLLDDSLTFEVSFKIKKMTGIYKDNLRCFDDPECSDVVLAVQDKRNNVSKLTLAAHSSYFKAMFLGLFGDSKKSEINLDGIDADDFQNYLEVLYGEDAIDEYTVEGILLVADMYDTHIVIKKCQQFLMKESKKTLKKKLELSVRYNMDELKKQCLSEIKTSNDIRAVLPSNIRDLDPSLMADLFEKSLASN